MNNRMDNGKVYDVCIVSEEGELATDSTNPVRISKGWSEPWQYGGYPLTSYDCETSEVTDDPIDYYKPDEDVVY